MTTTSSHSLRRARRSRRRVPAGWWWVARLAVFMMAVGLCVLLVVRPNAGLEWWWRLVVPLVPMLWLTVPGLWRNVCPLGTCNDAPRLVGVSRGADPPGWYRNGGPSVGMCALVVVVASRKLVFNQNAIATCLLIAGALVAALVGGVLFKNKIGWCNSICPMLSAERLYSHSPFVTVSNPYCGTCVACTKHCYDLNPRRAYLADLNDPDPRRGRERRLFAGGFPGLVIAYFTIANHTSALYLSGYFAVCITASVSSLLLAERVLPVTTHATTAAYGAFAFTLYCWFSAEVLSDTLTGTPNTAWFVWGLRVFAASLAGIWWVRTWRKEAALVEQTRTRTSAVLVGPTRRSRTT